MTAHTFIAVLYVYIHLIHDWTATHPAPKLNETKGAIP